MKTAIIAAFGAVLALAGAWASSKGAPPPETLLNASYEATRDFFRAYDAAFAREWKRRTGAEIFVRQSHQPSGQQAGAVANDLEADVVTLPVPSDVDFIAAKSRLLGADWRKRLPHGSSPYTTTVVFLVRKGNPKRLRDWPDLVKPGIEVIVPNPKTSGSARWTYAAAWGAARLRGGDEAAARAFMAELYRHAPVLDSGSRKAATTFIERRIGDVLVAYENEAMLALDRLGRSEVELVAPPRSVIVEPVAAVVDAYADRHGARRAAEAYVEYLYSPEAQELAARHHFRPRDPAAAARHSAEFPAMELFTLESQFGSWAQAQKTQFSEGGVFDQIYQPGVTKR